MFKPRPDGFIFCLAVLGFALSSCGTATPQADQPTSAPTVMSSPTKAAVAGLPAATATPTIQSTNPTAIPPTAVPSQPATTATPPMNVKPPKIIPLHITIKRGDKILVNTDVVTGGVMLTADGHKVPWTDDHLATWYAGYCGVGSFETCRAYVTAHRWRWKKAPEIPAPFAHLVDVRVGDEVIITTAEEGERHFIVTISQQIDDDDKKFITNKNITKQVVTFVTCTGTTQQIDGTTVASDRWVVQAEPVA